MKDFLYFLSLVFGLLLIVLAEGSRAGDFNNDGMEDLVWHHESYGAVALWPMNGGTISQSCFLGGVDPTEWNIVKVGDLDGDSKSDLAWNSRINNAIAVWFLDGCAIKGTSFVGTPGDLGWEVQPS